MTSRSEFRRTLRRLAATAALGSVIALGGAGAAGAADLTGTDIDITWLFPDLAHNIGESTVTVGPGVELSCAGNAAGSGVCAGFVDAADFDLGASTLTMTITAGASSYTNPAYNGYEFSGLAAGGAWTGYTLTTNFDGLDDSRVQFTPNAIFINMTGLAAPAGKTFTLTLTTGASGGGSGAPEPAAWAMMLIGFGGLGAVLRGQRRRAIAA